MQVLRISGLPFNAPPTILPGVNCFCIETNFFFFAVRLIVPFPHKSSSPRVVKVPSRSSEVTLSGDMLGQIYFYQYGQILLIFFPLIILLPEYSGVFQQIIYRNRNESPAICY